MAKRRKEEIELYLFPVLDVLINAIGALIVIILSFALVSVKSAVVAIEVKGSGRVDRRELRSLKTFVEAYSPKQALVVCTEQEERLHHGISIVPWRRFLRKLWAGEIIR